VIPRELVRRTLEFDSPERIPRHIWVLPWAVHQHPEQVAAIQKRFPDDVVTSPPFYRTPLPTVGDRYEVGTYTDEWGCTFSNLQRGIIGIVKTPSIRDWSDLETLRAPEERLSVDVDQVNRFCRQDGRFVLAGCWPRPFEQLQFLRGTENVLIDLATGSEGLTRLLRTLHEFYLRELELWSRTEVDALTLMDDWGSQDAMLISPAMWRAIFKPLYREYVEIARRSGKYFFMHSDGHIVDILDDLIELGVDAVNSQVACMGADLLGERFAGRMTFWGELDRQRLLPQGTPDEVREAVRHTTAALWRNGGLIAQCEFGLNARPENVQAAFEAWEAIRV